MAQWVNMTAGANPGLVDRVRGSSKGEKNKALRAKKARFKANRAA